VIQVITSRIRCKLSVRIVNHDYILALISGVISGFLGAAAGSLTFISTYNSLTYYFNTNKEYVDMDFRLKNMLIYIASDFTSSFVRTPFEVRKQLI
jgi:hypothetical protein